MNVWMYECMNVWMLYAENNCVESECGLIGIRVVSEIFKILNSSLNVMNEV